MTDLQVHAPDGVPEIDEGTDLAEALLTALGHGTGGHDLADGDVVVVTSKVVSKAEGRVRAGDRGEALADETARVVARRGPTTIVRTHHGLTMAAAGIDASNVALGSIVLLPVDPDASARRLRTSLHTRCGRVVGVVVTDTAGRAWREGQTDIAIGAAGLSVAESFAGRVDAHGNELAVTAPAVADEIAGASELAQGKLGGRPFAVVRGRADLVTPLDDPGPGAGALVRPEGADLFGYGAREAVVRALTGAPADQAPFGAAAAPEELAEAVARVSHGGATTVVEDGTLVVSTRDAGGAGVLAALVAPLAYAHGWHADARPAAGSTVVARLRPRTP